MLLFKNSQDNLYFWMFYFFHKNIGTHFLVFFFFSIPCLGRCWFNYFLTKVIFSFHTLYYKEQNVKQKFIININIYIRRLNVPKTFFQRIVVICFVRYVSQTLYGSNRCVRCVWCSAIFRVPEHPVHVYRCTECCAYNARTMAKTEATVAKNERNNFLYIYYEPPGRIVV